MAIFKILTLQIYECGGRSLHHLLSPSISFIKHLKIFLIQVFPLAYLESTQEGYCVEAIVKAIIPWFLSPYVCHLQIVHLFYGVRKRMCIYAVAHMWKLKDNLWVSVLSYVDIRAQTSVVPWQQLPFPIELSHQHSPKHFLISRVTHQILLMTSRHGP